MISLHYHRDDPVYIIRQRLFVADRYILYSFIFVCVYLDSGPLFSHVFCSEGTLSWMWKSFLVSKFYIFWKGHNWLHTYTCDIYFTSWCYNIFLPVWSSTIELKPTHPPLGRLSAPYYWVDVGWNNSFTSHAWQDDHLSRYRRYFQKIETE